MHVLAALATYASDAMAHKLWLMGGVNAQGNEMRTKSVRQIHHLGRSAPPPRTKPHTAKQNEHTWQQARAGSPACVDVLEHVLDGLSVNVILRSEKPLWSRVTVQLSSFLVCVGDYYLACLGFASLSEATLLEVTRGRGAVTGFSG